MTKLPFMYRYIQCYNLRQIDIINTLYICKRVTNGTTNLYSLIFKDNFYFINSLIFNDGEIIYLLKVSFMHTLIKS